MAYVETDGNIGLGSNGYNNGFFGGEGIWAVIVLFALLGYGGNGFGGWGGNGSGILNNYALGSDSAMISRQLESGFNSIERKGDYIQEQICNQTEAILNGFNTTNTNVMQTGFGITNAINGANVDSMQRSFALQQATNEGFSNVVAGQAQARYDSAMNTCNLQHAMCTNTRDIIDSQNGGTRAILEKLNAIQYDNLKTENENLRSRLQDARFDASQQAQSNYLINTLQPVSKPAYITASPYQSIYPYGYYGYGFNGGFGFGNGGTTIQ